MFVNELHCGVLFGSDGKEAKVKTVFALTRKQLSRIVVTNQTEIVARQGAAPGEERTGCAQARLKS